MSITTECFMCKGTGIYLSGSCPFCGGDGVHVPTQLSEVVLAHVKQATTMTYVQCSAPVGYVTGGIGLNA